MLKTGEKMKAEICRDGFIKITAETVAEAFALNYLHPTGQKHVCEQCGRVDLKITIDCSVLTAVDPKNYK